MTAPPIPSDNHPAIDVEGVSVSYGPVRAIDDVTLRADVGQTVALLGPNGAGKTTLVSVLVGLRRPRPGRVLVFGKPPAETVAEGRVGAMFQSSGLPAGATAGEALRLFGRLYPRPLPIDAAAEYAGIGSLLGTRLEHLSGGQAQRVRFALAIVGDPDLIFLDEPTVGMDVETRRSFWSHIDAWTSAGKTVIFATHYLDEVEAAADRVLVINSGRIVADAAPAELRGLAGTGTVSFAADTPDGAELAGLPGVRAVRVEGASVALDTGDPDATVAALYQTGMTVSGLEVTRGRLEDVFVSLTATNANADG